jgi:hypothetical protein
VDEYFRHCFEERKRRLGDKARLLPFTGNLFPNTSYHGRQPRGLCVWHPHSPTETEGWRFFLVDADAPAEVKDVLRRFYMRYSGPAGMTEQDDMENWNYAHAASRGTIARRYAYNYEQGLGAEVENYEWEGFRVPGTVCDLTQAKSSEQNLRNLYRRWGEFMAAESWDELMSWRRPARAQAAE